MAIMICYIGFTSCTPKISNKKKQNKTKAKKKIGLKKENYDLLFGTFRFVVCTFQYKVFELMPKLLKFFPINMQYPLQILIIRILAEGKETCPVDRLFTLYEIRKEHIIHEL